MTISCETIINQVDYSNKNYSNVDEIHVRNISEDETKNVYNDLSIDIDARDERMIYVDDDQETQKNIIKKFRFIQSQSFRVAARIYKAIVTKTLKMKLHILSINLHMKEMIIKIMI